MKLIHFILLLSKKRRSIIEVGFRFASSILGYTLYQIDMQGLRIIWYGFFLSLMDIINIVEKWHELYDTL
ncbi:hypothetical protein NC651_011214 [Populus alba x Populus x berolinensis]|nr:hypothetical protein NC651_011214 [Populus alba x Populus x berolinensis]